MNRIATLSFVLFTFLFAACTGDPGREDKSGPEQTNQGDDTQKPETDPKEDEGVDLGLSVRWASCNLGASKPEEFGDYYAWAETETYYSSLEPLTWKAGASEGYSWSSYRWAGDYPKFKKYCPTEAAIYWGKEGDPDNRTIIDPDDDAASVKIGQGWRIPSKDEWNELINDCKWTWTTLEGVGGYEVAATNGNSIFLPAAGLFDAVNLLDPGSQGAYWSSSLNTALPENAWILQSYPSYFFTASTLRYDGCSIRPVIK